jgi:HK97 family phage major capsid protein
MPAGIFRGTNMNTPEVKTAVEGLTQSVLALKTEHRNEISNLREMVERLSVKAGRAALGAALGVGADPRMSAEQKAGFERFLKTGDSRELKAVNLATSADGGFALPKEIHSEILRVEKSLSVMRKLARVETANTADFHVVISTTSAGASWVGENGTRSETTTPTFADVAPSMGELYAAPRVTNWALDDIPSISNWLTEEVAAQFAVAQDTAFLVGDGTNKPKGLLAGPTAATADASRAFGTIEHIATGVAGNWPATSAAIYDLLVTTAYKLRAAYRQNAAWIMSAAAVDRLRKVKESTTDAPIWTPGMGATPATLLGFPVYESEDMPAVAANSLSVAFGDFRKAYLITDRAETSVIVDPYSTRGSTIFYTSRRTGGALLDSNAVKVIKFATA